MAELTFVFLRVSIRTQWNIRKLDLDLEVTLELVGFFKCQKLNFWHFLAYLLEVSGGFIPQEML